MQSDASNLFRILGRPNGVSRNSKDCRRIQFRKIVLKPVERIKRLSRMGVALFEDMKGGGHNEHCRTQVPRPSLQVKSLEVYTFIHPTRSILDDAWRHQRCCRCQLKTLTLCGGERREGE